MSTCGRKVSNEADIESSRKVSSFIEAQIRLVNYCCTLLYKSVLDHDNEDNPRSRSMEINHLMYAEEHRMNHSLSSGILTFLNVVRCRKEIERFYRENEHFRELLSVMKQKYGSTSEYFSRDPSIADALTQVINVMFDRQQRKKKKPIHRIEEENRAIHKCSNSLCQMTENNVRRMTNLPNDLLFSSFSSKDNSKFVLIVVNYHIAVNIVEKFIGH